MRPIQSERSRRISQEEGRRARRSAGRRRERPRPGTVLRRGTVRADSLLRPVMTWTATGLWRDNLAYADRRYAALRTIGR
jgi:hypothetical protein